MMIDARRRFVKEEVLSGEQESSRNSQDLGYVCFEILLCKQGTEEANRYAYIEGTTVVVLKSYCTCYTDFSALPKARVYGAEHTPNEVPAPKCPRLVPPRGNNSRSSLAGSATVAMLQRGEMWRVLGVTLTREGAILTLNGNKLERYPCLCCVPSRSTQHGLHWCM